MTTLPTSGRVVIQTTVGDIEVELWSKETPLACRNFLTLALEGYYDGVIFHRVVPNFLVQTGDRTGTGTGGESLYGEPFDDEIHPRLRFTHRGLVGMANNGEQNTNTSQFFITLDRADELHGKHTLFGRVIGDTIYNVIKIGELELDENERPVYAPKIRQIKIVDNPFHDIVPRITAAEKRAQQLAREQMQREREEASKRKKGKKDSKLLSFGDDGEGDNDALQFKKKPIFRTDLVVSEPSKQTPDVPLVRTSKPKAKDPEIVRPDMDAVQEKEEIPKPKKSKSSEVKTESDKRKEEFDRVEEEIRKLTRRRDSDSEDDKPAKKTKKGPSIIEQQNAKYQRGTAAARRAAKKKDDSSSLSALERFRSKLQRVQIEDVDDADAPPEGEDEAKGEEAMDVDDDVGWISHRLHFAKDDAQETSRAEHDYEVIDPRMRGAKAKEEEMERKRSKKDGHGYKPRSQGPRR
ncbi:Peptidyl-prolyl isomerase cwc27 [Serendipita sp. 405]|nr:Peptidyl-prolyl isomerase cwc27 [Serendipita sp. 397]KAG8868898.1 Peptidyl-prolyl isomerase cwc27 [Serendipita sp. 405]